MPDSYWIFVAVGLALVAAALGYGLSAVHNTQQRVSDLEDERMFTQLAMRKLTSNLADQQRRIEQLEARPQPKAHGSVALAQSNSVEAALFEAGKVVSQLTIATAQVDNMMLKLEWMRDGGNPDAPWATIVRWKSEKAGNK